jgi:2-hydroxychromene-2-carboxylate isomerase
MKVSWVFDVISPFAYLARTRLGRLPANVTVEFVPVLFAGLLSHFGQLGPAEVGPKRRFTYRFTLWRARQLGVPMHWPPAHPFNPLAALRLIIAAGSDARAVEVVFNAIFAEGENVEDPEVIEALARKLGIDDLSKLGSAETKTRLRDNTDWAIGRGVFGVPTLVIGEETFWGFDGFDLALDYLRDPAQFADAEMKRLEQLPVGAVRAEKRS